MYLINIPHDIYYVVFAAFMALAMIILVPRSDIKQLFAFCLIWGSVGSFLLIKIFSPGVLNLFRWEETAFSFWSSPLVINLAWAPAFVLFLHFRPKPRHLFALYLLTFSLVSTAIDRVFNQLGSLEYIMWNPIARFIVSLIWFSGAALHYYYLVEGTRGGRLVPS